MFAQAAALDADEERREHCLHYAGCDWGDRYYYHLMLDSSMATDEQVAEAIYSVIHCLAAE